MSDSALPPQQQDKEMTLVQHLLEFRNALTKGILAILVLFFVLFPFANDLYIYISEPLTRFLPDDTSMIATGVASPFLTPFKLSLVLAIYFAMPFLFFQVWQFIEPALYDHEKKLIGPILFFSSFLFYAGGAFAYYVVFPLVFGFLSTAAPDGVTIATDIALYLDFVIKMFFAFGMAFEVPIVVVLLILTGMASPKKLAHIRPYIIVGAFVIGMLLTPPDIISQTLLAIPIWLLYEAGIIVGAWVIRNRKDPEEEGNDPDPEPSDPKPTGSNSTAMNDSPSNSAAPKTPASTATATQTKAEPEYDDRYADQRDDDLDWDEEFDRIENEMSKLDKEYAARQALEKEQKKQKEQQAKDGKDSNNPLDKDNPLQSTVTADKEVKTESNSKTP